MSMRLLLAAVLAAGFVLTGAPAQAATAPPGRTQCVTISWNGVVHGERCSTRRPTPPGLEHCVLIVWNGVVRGERCWTVWPQAHRLRHHW